MVGQERAAGVIYLYLSRAFDNMKCGVGGNPVRRTSCSRACVLSHWWQCAETLRLGVEPRFEGVIHKLALVQKALGGLVGALKTPSAWKRRTRGLSWGKEIGLFCFFFLSV